MSFSPTYTSKSECKSGRETERKVEKLSSEEFLKMHATLRDSPRDTSVHPFSASSFPISSSSRPASASLLLLFFAEERSLKTNERTKRLEATILHAQQFERRRNVENSRCVSKSSAFVLELSSVRRADSIESQ